MNKLGEKIRKLRKMKGLTLEDLDELTNLHYTYLAKIEHGKTEPSLKSLRKIAEALDTRASFLLEDEKNGEKELLISRLIKNLEGRDIKDIEFAVSLIGLTLKKIEKYSRKKRKS